MPDLAAIALIVDLVDQAKRAAGAERLAERLGLDAVLLFARDPMLDVLIPAPGCPQTIRGGKTWREFLAACTTPGRYQARVELPEGRDTPALAIVLEGSAVVLLGGPAPEAEVNRVERWLPLLCPILAVEQEVVVARAEAATARDIADRAHALAAALEAARAEGSRLNESLRDEQRQKDEFLAMLGHELRNPLSPLVNSIEVLRRGDTSVEAEKGLVEVMARQVGKLARLVEDLLEVSRVSRGLIALRREPLLLADVLRDAVDESRPLIAARGHELTISIRDRWLQLSGDRVRLTQAFGNLLLNAAKYTDSGGKISLSARLDGEEIVVQVTDNGIGIPPAMLPRIFDLFTQAHTSLDRAESGLGIGLTLVRTLVELHGGRVSAESPGEQQGSTFTVRLPRIEGVIVPGPAPRAAEVTSLASGMRVMVVDDNQDAADSQVAILRMMGHDAKVAYSGSSAIEYAETFAPHLFLLDLGLPDMDGYELVRRLRTGHGDARFVALTGYAPEAGGSLAGKLFDEHVVKPIGLKMLEDVIGRVPRESV